MHVIFIAHRIRVSRGWFKLALSSEKYHRWETTNEWMHCEPGCWPIIVGCIPVDLRIQDEILRLLERWRLVGRWPYWQFYLYLSSPWEEDDSLPKRLKRSLKGHEDHFQIYITYKDWSEWHYGLRFWYHNRSWRRTLLIIGWLVEYYTTWCGCIAWYDGLFWYVAIDGCRRKDTRFVRYYMRRLRMYGEAKCWIYYIMLASQSASTSRFLKPCP